MKNFIKKSKKDLKFNVIPTLNQKQLKGGTADIIIPDLVDL